MLDCNCSICAKTGFRHLIVPHGDFRLLARRGRADQLSLRHRRRRTICSARTCGVKSFYQPRSHPEAWSVNLNALDDVSGLAVTATAFDGRDWEAAKAALDRASGEAEQSEP